MMIGVIEGERSCLAPMIALACESMGHQCLVFKDVAHVTSILHDIRMDKIVVDIERPGLNALDWLETMTPSWPDLPSRTLLLAESELTSCVVARIQKLGAEFVSTPPSLVDAKLIVMERLQHAVPEETDRALCELEQAHELFATMTEVFHGDSSIGQPRSEME